MNRYRTLLPLFAALLCTTSLGVAHAGTGERKSIGSFVSCSGTGDDTSGATKAFAAAKNGAFTLVVDCPVRLHSGIAVDRGIFIDNDTTVEFTGSGKFIVDNLFHPAFVIANSSNISLTNWNVVWEGVQPLDGSTGGYELDGRFVAGAAGSKTQPAAAFNDIVLTKWLASNRGVDFRGPGWSKAIWVGGVNPGAIFFITGDTSNVVFKGLHLSVPVGVGGDHFLPMAISLSPNWKSNQTVSGALPHNSQYAAVPHGLTFADVDFDGTLMGWQGNARDVTFDHIQSHRYGDLQDANGGTSGGIGKWFPPPHLFYLNYPTDGDPQLFNANIHISNVLDSGPRVGVARDKGAGDSVSGYATSLKLGCVNCSVDHYTTLRPDGFMDVLSSNNLTISNVNATFDSVFLNNAFPGALRFPASGYTHVVFENVVLKDLAEAPSNGPIGNAPAAANEGIVFRNVEIVFNRWTGPKLPTPTIGGSDNDVTLEFVLADQHRKLTCRLQSDGHWSAPIS
jgi:hypothetical protein